MNELKSTLERERKTHSDKLHDVEKERMQWQLERDTLGSVKAELEEKCNTLGQRLKETSKELEQLRKPPVNLKVKDATKCAIKDLMKNNILQKNSSNSSFVDVTSTTSLKKTETTDEDSVQREGLLDDSSKENKFMSSVQSKRLLNIGKSPMRNKFKLNLFGNDKEN